MTKETFLYDNLMISLVNLWPGRHRLTFFLSVLELMEVFFLFTGLSFRPIQFKS